MLYLVNPLILFPDFIMFTLEDSIEALERALIPESFDSRLLLLSKADSEKLMWLFFNAVLLEIDAPP